MLSKVGGLYEQLRSKMVSLRVVEVPKLREKINKLTDEEEAKDLEL